MNDAWFFTISTDKFVKGNIKQTMDLLQNINYQNNGVYTREKWHDKSKYNPFSYAVWMQHDKFQQ